MLPRVKLSIQLLMKETSEFLKKIQEVKKGQAEILDDLNTIEKNKKEQEIREELSSLYKK